MTWKEKVQKNLYYYYNLKDIYPERVAYNQKATNIGLTDDKLADTNRSDSHQDTITNNIVENLHANGMYETLTVCS